MRTLALIYLLTAFSLFGQPANLFPGAAYVVTKTAASGPTNNLNGLVAWYSFDDTSGTDLSGNGHTLTIVSLANVTGIITNAVAPTAKTGYATRSQSLASANMTIMFWIEKTNHVTDVDTVIAAGDATSSGNGNDICANVSDVNFYFNGGGTYECLTFPQPPIGVWWHYAVTATNNSGVVTVSSYTNGSFCNSSTTGPLVTSATEFMIANEYAGASRNFGGYYDDVRIYNRALSATEITNQYRWPPGSGR